MPTREAAANIEDLLPLSPMQEGMLYHSLSSDRLDIYLHQVVFTLEGRFHPAVFEATLRTLIKRHIALRSGFVWRQGDKPVQVVFANVDLALQYLDWRDLGAGAVSRQRAELLQRERMYQMDLARPPLLRVFAIRLAQERTALLWNMHHILMDGWSLALIVGELVVCYGELLDGREPLLPPVQPYQRYIAWLEKQPSNDAERFWRATLQGFSSATPLPSSNSAGLPAADRREYAQVERTLSPEITSRLVSLAQANRVTLNTVVQGAWALLLSRYSGCTDIVFGATSSGRPPEVAGIEAMVGNFMNTLPVRVRLDGCTLIPWLAAIQRDHASGRQYEYAPLVNIQRWSEVRPGSPLFESIVVFENYPIDSRLVEGRGALRITHMEVIDQTNYPLTLVAGPGAAMRCRLLYDIGRFSAAYADQMLRHLENLLESFTERPGSKLTMFRIISSAERLNYTKEWNLTGRPYRHTGRIHQAFECAASRDPGRVAIVSREARWTYAELNARANRIARLLARLGVRRGDLVGVLMNRCPDAIACLLAILKAGAAYVPIEPAYPDARVSYILSQLRIRVLLSGSSQLPRLAGIASALPHLEHVFTAQQTAESALPFSTHGPAELEGLSAEDPNLAGESDGLAYVIFTSGSTGEPKGVMVRHRPVINLIEWVNREFNITPADQLLFVTSFCFDLSVYDIFGLLAAGASIRIASEEEIRNPDQLLAILRNEPITFWDSAPAAIRQITPALEAPRATRGSRLRLVFLSGDWIPVTLPAQLMAAFPGVEVVSLGGATEATVWSNFYAISEVPSEATSIPYGRPIQNARYYILDQELEPQPPGLPGDLWIAGECLADGYFGKPALTAEAFLPDPFADTAGARMYRTGDLARFFPDRNIEFLGRRDQQVKIRGFRIELSEIEAVLARHPAVESVALTAHGEDRTDRRLVAYVVPASDQAPVLRRLLELEKAGRLKRHACFELPDGSPVAHRNRKETEFSYREIFEYAAYFQHGVTLRPGACVFDVGSNIGLFAIQVLRSIPNAAVYAFEPIEPVFDSLTINAALYGGGRLKAIHCALGSRRGRAEMTYYPEVTIQSGFYAQPELDRQLVKEALRNGAASEPSSAELDLMLDAWMSAETCFVEVRTLSEVIADEGLDRIDLLKINAERSELDVLAGLEERDWAKIRQIVIEAHSQQAFVEIVGMLEQRGYLVASQHPAGLLQSPLCRIYARRPDSLQDPIAQAPLQRPAACLGPTTFVAELRAHIRSQLPDYMVPAHFVLLPGLPVSASGKVDRKALPAPDPHSPAHNYVPPQDDVAVALAGIWTDLLGVERVGVNDNFFELGGDSILSIQAAARAKRAGLSLTPRDLFERPTIARLAQVARAASVPETAAPSFPGETPLTPIQRWWFRQRVQSRESFTNSVLIDLPCGGRAEVWSAAISALIQHHDELRANFREAEDGDWRCTVLPVVTAGSFWELDLRGIPESRRSVVLRRAALQVRRMSLTDGPLFRGILARKGEQDVLQLVAHHLVTDAVSWRLLIDDLYRAWTQLSSGQPPCLGEKTASFRSWAERLEAYGAGAEVQNQLPYWSTVESLRSSLTVRPAGSAERHSVVATLTREETQKLLRQANLPYHTNVEELLLAALAPVLEEWLGTPQIVIDVEGHGREDIAGGLDVSRTVGWFTTLYPFVLENAQHERETIIRVKEKMRAVPGKGIGYRFLQNSGRESWGEPPGVIVNYLGQFSGSETYAPWLHVSPDPWGADPAGRVKVHPLAISCFVTQGQMQVSWEFENGLLDPQRGAAVVDRFMTSLRGIIDHCCSPEAGALTPSDVASFQFSPAEFEEITSAIEEGIAH